MLVYNPLVAAVVLSEDGNGYKQSQSKIHHTCVCRTTHLVLGLCYTALRTPPSARLHLPVGTNQSPQQFCVGYEILEMQNFARWNCLTSSKLYDTNCYCRFDELALHEVGHLSHLTHKSRCWKCPYIPDMLYLINYFNLSEFAEKLPMLWASWFLGL